MISEIENILNEMKFPKQKRPNISENRVEGVVLGEVMLRGQKWFNGATRGEGRFNKKFNILHTKLKELISSYDKDFEYTTIQINKNVVCPPHIDKNNVGISYIIGIGDYDGGELNVEGEKIDIKYKFFKFDGTKGHWTEPFTGNRFTIVYFTHTFTWTKEELKYLKVTKEGVYDKKNKLIKSYIDEKTKMTK